MRSHYRLGIDAKLGAQFGAMMVFEKRNLYKGINLIAGVGMYSHDVDLEYSSSTYQGSTSGNITSFTTTKSYSGESYIKMGINKTFVLTGKPVTPSMELVGSDEGVFPSFSIAYHLRKLFF